MILMYTHILHIHKFYCWKWLLHIATSVTLIISIANSKCQIKNTEHESAVYMLCFSQSHHHSRQIHTAAATTDALHIIHIRCSVSFNVEMHLFLCIAIVYYCCLLLLHNRNWNNYCTFTSQTDPTKYKSEANNSI